MSASERFGPGSKAHRAALALLDAWGWAEVQANGKPQGRLEWDGAQWGLFDEPDGQASELLTQAQCPIQAVIEAEMGRQEVLYRLRGEGHRAVILEAGLRWPLGDSL
ncbi:hypothetical protein [Myxococcus sp. CA040A]|uniref:hypothetical protein n=1 Tax=Myxococcus sp. CA040A TaxID=2741738 RepID=UPI00157B204D|nr:hypothetical protein [Myxococcus sp. CA040A]NTX08971.1 hypothetical protein [Myxococcus sp. CA040A]